MTDNIPQTGFIVSDFSSLFAFYLTQYTAVEYALNNMFIDVKVYGDEIIDQRYIKLLKLLVIYAERIAALRSASSFNSREKEVFDNLLKKYDNYLIKLNNKSSIKLKEAIEIVNDIVKDVGYLSIFRYSYLPGQTTTQTGNPIE